MMVGVGAIATNEVLRPVEDAQEAGADALLLPMMSYHAFRGGDLCLYEEVCRHVSVPVCLYDNPRTTHVMLADELQGASPPCRPLPRLKFPACPRHRRANV